MPRLASCSACWQHHAGPLPSWPRALRSRSAAWQWPLHGGRLPALAPRYKRHGTTGLAPARFESFAPLPASRGPPPLCSLVLNGAYVLGLCHGSLHWALSARFRCCLFDWPAACGGDLFFFEEARRRLLDSWDPEGEPDPAFGSRASSAFWPLPYRFQGLTTLVWGPWQLVLHLLSVDAYLALGVYHVQLHPPTMQCR